MVKTSAKVTAYIYLSASLTGFSHNLNDFSLALCQDTVGLFELYSYSFQQIGVIKMLPHHLLSNSS